MFYYILVPAKSNPKEFDTLPENAKTEPVLHDLIFTNERKDSIFIFSEEQIKGYQANKGKGWRKIADPGVTYALFKVDISDAANNITEKATINAEDAARHQLKFLLAAKPQILVKPIAEQQVNQRREARKTMHHSVKTLTLKKTPTIEIQTSPQQETTSSIPTTTEIPATTPTTIETAKIQNLDSVATQEKSEPKPLSFDKQFEVYRWLINNAIYDYLVNKKNWQLITMLDEEGNGVINEETNKPYEYLAAPDNKPAEKYSEGEQRGWGYLYTINVYYDYNPKNPQFNRLDHELASNLAILAALTITGGAELTGKLLALFVENFPNLDTTTTTSIGFWGTGGTITTPDKTKIRVHLLGKLFAPYIKEGIMENQLESIAREIDILITNPKNKDEENIQTILSKAAKLNEQLSELQAKNAEAKAAKAQASAPQLSPP